VKAHGKLRWAETYPSQRIPASLNRPCPLLEEDSTAHRTSTPAEASYLSQSFSPISSFVPIALFTVGSKCSLPAQLGRAICRCHCGANALRSDRGLHDMKPLRSDAITRPTYPSAIEHPAPRRRALQRRSDSATFSMCGFGSPVAKCLTATKTPLNLRLAWKVSTSAICFGDQRSGRWHAGSLSPRLSRLVLFRFFVFVPPGSNSRCSFASIS